MKIRFQLGDVSRDGHGISEDIYFDVNMTLKGLEDAYAKSLESTGINFESIAEDYEDYTVPNDILERFLEYPSFHAFIRKKWDYLDHGTEIDRMIEEWQDDTGMPIDEPAFLIELMLWFASLSFPGLTWKAVSDDKIPTFSRNFGYGLFSL